MKRALMKNSSSFLLILFIFPYQILFAIALPRYDYAGKSQEDFITDALTRSSPGAARLLGELFGGLEVGLNLGGGSQAVISVGGAATRCQHQSPCYDSHCRLCYDPLMRIHGKCGGASYFTCRGTLPKGCLPFSCTARAAREFTPEKLRTTVFVKKFSRFQDPFCLGKFQSTSAYEKELNATVTFPTSSSLTYHPHDSARARNGPEEDPDWVMSVPEAITPCQSYDICVDLKCGHCYDPYLGIHTSCGKMTYYDCLVNLPKECAPMMCTDTNIRELFPNSVDDIVTKRTKNRNEESDETERDFGIEPEESPLMVRSFVPLVNENKNCV